MDHCITDRLSKFFNRPEFLIQNELNSSFNSNFNSETEIARAAIYLACKDAGLSPLELDKVNSALNDLPTTFAGGPDYAENGTALDAIIRGALCGDDWEIVVLLYPTALPGREVGVLVTWAGWIEGPEAQDLARVQLRGELGTLRIRASKLLRPMLAEG